MPRCEPREISWLSYRVNDSTFQWAECETRGNRTPLTKALLWNIANDRYMIGFSLRT